MLTVTCPSTHAISTRHDAAASGAEFALFPSSLFESAFILASTTPRERGCWSTAPFSTNNNTWLEFARFESTV